MKLVCPVREQDEDPFTSEAPRKEGRERPRRAVRPMSILEDQEQGVLLCNHVEQLEQRLEQPQLRGWVMAPRVPFAGGFQSGQQRRELPATAWPERIERRVPGPHQRAQRAG